MKALSGTIVAFAILLGHCVSGPGQEETNRTTLRITQVKSAWTSESSNATKSDEIVRSAALTIPQEAVSDSAIRLTQGVLSTPVTGSASPNRGSDSGGDLLSADSIMSAPQSIAPGDQDRKIVMPDGNIVNLHENEEIATPTPRPQSGTGVTGGTTVGNTGNQGNLTGSGQQKRTGWMGTGRASRRDDGSMIGNPYASIGNAAPCAVAEYRPGQIPFDPSELSQRGYVPEGVEGTDGWGNPAAPDSSLASGNGFCYFLFKNMQLEAGLTNYASPLDYSARGNVGGNLSLNWSTPQTYLLGLSLQGGGRLTTTSNNFFAWDEAGVLPLEQHKENTQLFWTTGIFYRNPCNPWRFGVVYDSLNSTYYSKYTLGQIRVEFSRKVGERNDIGYRGAFHVSNNIANLWRYVGEFGPVDIPAKVRTTSYYTGFIRHYFDMGGEGTLYGGVNDLNEPLFGGQIEVPIGNYVTLKNSFNYVFTKDGPGVLDHDSKTKNQNWNLSISLVVYFGGNSRENMRNPLRPLFDVADNGSFMQTGISTD